jgi:hypothetical protein
VGVWIKVPYCTVCGLQYCVRYSVKSVKAFVEVAVGLSRDSLPAMRYLVVMLTKDECSPQNVVCHRGQATMTKNKSAYLNCGGTDHLPKNRCISQEDVDRCVLLSSS